MNKYHQLTIIHCLLSINKSSKTSLSLSWWTACISLAVCTLQDCTVVLTVKKLPRYLSLRSCSVIYYIHPCFEFGCHFVYVNCFY